MKSYILILFVGLSAVLHSQNTITGTITNTENEKLLGVEVYINELHKGTSTNEKGYFELTNLPSNTLKITVAYIGYKTEIKTIKLTQEITTLNFVLKESVFKMDEVIISTPFNKLQSQNVMKVEKTTLKQIQNQGAVTLNDGINTIPGVETVSTGIGIGKPVIRGLRGNRVLVYSSGIRLENQQWGDEHGLGVDDSSIESLEVIKGPASLLYGSDALGGVLYFNPAKFAKTNELDLNAGHTYFSNTEGSKTHFGFKKSFNSWKFLANGSRSEHSDYKTSDVYRVSNTRFNETNFNSAIGYNNKFISSALRFSYNRSNIGIPEEIGEQTTEKHLELPYQDLTTKMISFDNTIFLGESKITAIGGYTFNTRKEFEDEHHHDEHEEGDLDEDEHDEHEEVFDPSILLKLKTYNYDVKWHLPKSENFEAIVGVQGMHQTNENGGEEILIPNAKTNDIGVMATAIYSKGIHNLQGGVRFDYRSLDTEEHIIAHEDELHVFNALDKSFENISASLGYKTTLFNNIETRLNLASGFKAPNLSELSSNGVHHGSNRFELGNSDLDSERNYQSDLSLEYKTNHFEITVNGFYNYISDYIFISPTREVEDGFEVYEYIQDDAKLYGGEFGLHLHPHPLDWLHIYSNFEMVIGKQDNGEYLPLIPANKLTNTLRAEFNSIGKFKNNFLSLTYENTFKQDNVGVFETPTSSYNLLNFGAGTSYSFNKVNLDFNLNLNNALDKGYISHLSRLKSNGIQNIGRNVVASLKISI
ncbi:iron complex outermembrane recepter protein [Lutibacter oricola]|uniref:Iron complex outermembrane recepter protein n=1 Tax=Lutibacter oricola TaxID=762486 RepID=A0A1H3EUJ4_9FLAO|nr:TonB-dependent receptor [Lutibacter oricola]SDX82443.1 iron complex outermembrane recepter protein [Lutibacter oricola]